MTNLALFVLFLSVQLPHSYRLVAIDHMVTAKWTYVAAEGRVAAVDQDGSDRVVWLAQGDATCPPRTERDRRFCLATFIIPLLPLKPPPVGSTALVQGVYRYNRMHFRPEIRPVENIIVRSGEVRSDGSERQPPGGELGTVPRR